jgi:hypothetical protein
MPNYARERSEPQDDLEIAARVMDTVQKQIASYRLSLEKVRSLRQECQIDERLNERLRSDPREMATILIERGIPQPMAVSMAAEDFRSPDFGGELALWTWDCCCTGCCVTSCIGTNITNVAVLQFDELPGRGEETIGRRPRPKRG